MSNKMNLGENMDAKMCDTPEAKKPCKGILKTSSSFDKQSTSSISTFRKNAKFDEINVQQTYHPVDKDYGHMKVDEPKTPFAFAIETDPGQDFDAEILAEKLRKVASNQSPGFDYDEDSDGEEVEETLTERVHRLEFEQRRKAHYNEYKAVLLARKLIQVELEAGSEEDGENKSMPEEEASAGAAAYDASANSDCGMEVGMSKNKPVVAATPEGAAMTKNDINCDDNSH